MSRIKGTSKTETIRPTVRLVSMTDNPIGSLVALWIGSRYEKSVEAYGIQYLYDYCKTTPISELNYNTYNEHSEELARYLCDCYPEYAGDNHDDFYNVIKNVASMVIDANLPPSDSVLFTFEIDNANVAWRDQLVRSRANFTNFWTQTSRTADLTTIDVNMSESIKNYGGEEAVKVYTDTVQSVRDAYVKLSELGVPTEDIRLFPQGMTHRVYWIVGLRTLLSIIPKRTSWIAQATLWSPIVQDIMDILNNLNPLFSSKFGTPLDVKIKDGKVINHTYDNENEDRYYNRDSQPVDPLWLAYKGLPMPKHTNLEFYDRMKSYYIKLWSDEILEILEWDRNDPSKLGPYDRHPDLVESKVINMDN